MGARILTRGNIAVGWAAIAAECDAYFGYPITPQNEIPEWFSEEFPKRGKVFLQTQSETATINMLFGAACAGFRVMTSTSTPGWGLMQETLAHMCNAELPCVIALVQRGGPGQGTTRHGQADYFTATRGGCGGNINIVLAPDSVQETYDLIQLAFYLADKYCNPAVLLTDAIIGQMMEPLEPRKLDFGPLAEKDWAMVGTGRRRGGKRQLIISSKGFLPVPGRETFVAQQAWLDKKFRAIAENEVRYENYQLEGARLVLVAYGYCARVCKEAVNRARAEGLPVGLLRPITVWPFPREEVKRLAEEGCQFLVVEDCLGQMIQDVELAVAGKASISTLNVLDRHLPTDEGVILPKRVLTEVKKILSKVSRTC